MQYLVLEVLEKHNGQTLFQICYQSHRNRDFARSGEFFARNGVCMASVSVPQIRSGYSGTVFYVRGSNENGDNTILSCPDSVFEKIKIAVREYNEKYGD